MASKRNRYRATVAQRMVRVAIRRRRWIQGLLGLLVLVALNKLGVSLWSIVVFGSLAGIVLGKFFCRWMCPLGFMMELMLGAGGGDEQQRAFYNYFKVGCPIAWASGLLNRFSWFRVNLDADRCKHCGLCDQACYVSQMDMSFSLHRPETKNASEAYSCSRCLDCVQACPVNALQFKESWFARLRRDGGVPTDSKTSDIG